MPVLVVNVDHIATLRQARLAREPDPVHAACLAELGGAQGIIVHLREDRRHIQDRDLELLQQTVQTGLHLEMAATQEMQKIALQTGPRMVCLVPEKRQELTTEGGLDLLGREKELQGFLQPLQQRGMPCSLFIDPDHRQIQAAREVGAEYIELHTGSYADAASPTQAAKELDKLLRGIEQAQKLDLHVNLGHGLNYTNIQAFARVSGIKEFSIGHSIVARAALVGMQQAVRDMAKIISTFRE
ncbi:MAG: pyridoxine 5'-phosphate synthase [Desulfohalobiaceae bacterium]